MSDAQLVKIRFKLEQDDGWPPFTSEGLWAESLGDDLYRIDNTPWFVFDLASGDIVRAVTQDDGCLWAVERTQWAGRMTIRVIPQHEGDPTEAIQGVLDAAAPMGVSGEGFARIGMVALDVPQGADHAGLKRLLSNGEAAGQWSYEEACVSQEWLQL
jgi:hypothetical protein